MFHSVAKKPPIKPRADWSSRTVQQTIFKPDLSRDSTLILQSYSHHLSPKPSRIIICPTDQLKSYILLAVYFANKASCGIFGGPLRKSSILLEEALELDRMMALLNKYGHHKLLSSPVSLDDPVPESEGIGTKRQHVSFRKCRCCIYSCLKSYRQTASLEKALPKLVRILVPFRLCNL